MAPPLDRRPPMAVALEWVSRITAVAMVMVLPGMLGYWLDTRFETRFLAPAGFVLGIVCGMWSLLALTGAVGKSRKFGAGKKLGAGKQMGDRKRTGDRHEDE